MAKINSTFIAMGAGVLLIGGLIAFVVLRAPGDNEESRLSPLLSRDGLHWHADVAITIDGEAIAIPDDTGLGVSHNPLHTHEGEPNQIHLELSGVVREDDIKLGKFFDVWGEQLSSTCLLDSCGDEGSLKMRVNGEENTEFENYVMQDDDQIELEFTSP